MPTILKPSSLKAGKVGFPTLSKFREVPQGTIHPWTIPSTAKVGTPQQPPVDFARAYGHSPTFAYGGNIFTAVGDATHQLGIVGTTTGNATGSWSLFNQAGAPSSYPTFICSAQFNEFIFVATWDNTSYQLHIFNANTLVWLLTGSNIDTPTTLPDYPWITMDVIPGDPNPSDYDVIVLYAGTPNLVTLVQRVYGKQKYFNGSWSSNILAGGHEMNNTSEHIWNPVCVKQAGASDRDIYFTVATAYFDLNDPLNTFYPFQAGRYNYLYSQTNGLSVDDITPYLGGDFVNNVVNIVPFLAQAAEIWGGLTYAGSPVLLFKEVSGHLEADYRVPERQTLFPFKAYTEEAVQAVPPDAPAILCLTSLAVDPATLFLYAVFIMANNPDYSADTLVVVRSTDLGESWGPYQLIAEVSGATALTASVININGNSKLAVNMVGEVISDFSTDLLTLSYISALNPSEETLDDPLLGVPTILPNSRSSTSKVSAYADSGGGGFGTGMPSPSLLLEGQMITRSSNSSSTVGSPILANGSVTPIGIISGESFGAAEATRNPSIKGNGIPSAESFGSPAVFKLTGTSGKVATILFGTLALLPYEAVVPCKEELEWLTDVMITYSGAEKRIKVRGDPRQSFTYSIPEGVQTKTAAFVLQYSAIGLDWAVPIWVETQIVGSIAAMDTTITLVTDDYDFRDSSLALVYQSRAVWEVIEIATVGAGVLNLLTPMVRSFTAAKVMPVRLGTINGMIRKKNTGHSAITSITFAIKDNLAVEELVPALQYLGNDVYTDELLRTSTSFNQDILTKQIQIDFDLGLFDKIIPWDNSRVRRSSGYLLTTPTEVKAFRRFLERRSGKYAQFWEPSFESDMQILDTGALGATFLIREEGQGAWESVRRHLGFLASNGTWYFRKALNFSQQSETTAQVTLDLPLGLNAEDITLVSYVSLRRFDTDTVEITWLGNNVASIFINTVEISP
jgi:hypothetical protein